MLNKNLLLKVSSLLVVGVMLASSPAFAAGPKDSDKGKQDKDDITVQPTLGFGNTGPLAMPAAGKGSLVFINYNGGSEELDITLNNLLYKIAPSTNGGNQVWNQVQVDLAPGTYSYTAFVAGNDTVINNTVEVVAGKITGLGFYDNLADVKDGDKGSDDHEGRAKAASETESSHEQLRDARGDSDDLLLGVSDMTALAH